MQLKVYVTNMRDEMYAFSRIAYTLTFNCGCTWVLHMTSEIKIYSFLNVKYLFALLDK
jgi:hypothetical protein